MPIEGPISQIVIDAYPKGEMGLDWASWIQAGSAIGSLIATAIFGTYAYFLQRNSQKEFDLINRPYLHIDPNTNTMFLVNETNQLAEKFRAEFMIKNVGHLPLACVVEQMTINEVLLVQPNNPIVIFPGQELSVWTDFVESPQPINMSTLIYTASITARYWPLNDTRKIHRRHQKQRMSLADKKNAILEDEAD